MAHTPGQSMSGHRTSYQLSSHHVVDTSHKDTDNKPKQPNSQKHIPQQPKQPLLMDIPAEPCSLSSSQTDCDVLQQLQDSAPKDDFLENSQGSQDNKYHSHRKHQSQSPLTKTHYPSLQHLHFLSFSQKMEELVYAGTNSPTLRCKPPDIN